MFYAIYNNLLIFSVVVFIIFSQIVCKFSDGIFFNIMFTLRNAELNYYIEKHMKT